MPVDAPDFMRAFLEEPEASIERADDFRSDLLYERIYPIYEELDERIGLPDFSIKIGTSRYTGGHELVALSLAAYMHYENDSVLQALKDELGLYSQYRNKVVKSSVGEKLMVEADDFTTVLNLLQHHRENNTIEDMAGARCVRDGKEVLIQKNALPPQYVKRYQQDQVPDIMYPICRLISSEERTEQEFRALMVHEATHAYISQRTDAHRTSIHEGAAFTCNNILGLDYDIDIDHYGPKSSRSALQVSRKLFMDIASDYDSEVEKIHAIWEKAAEAHRRIAEADNYISEREAILGHEDEELADIAQGIFAVAKAEKSAVEAFVLLNELPPDEATEYIRSLDIFVREMEIDELNQLIPEEAVQEEKEGLMHQFKQFIGKTQDVEKYDVSLRKLEAGMEKLEELASSGDLSAQERQALEGCEQDLSRVLELYTEEDKFVRHLEQQNLAGKTSIGRWTKHGNEEQVADMLKEVISNSFLTSPENMSFDSAEEELVYILSDHLEAVNAALNYIGPLEDNLADMLRNEEAAMKAARNTGHTRDYRVLKELFDSSKKLYRLTDESRQMLEHAQDVCVETLERLKS